MNNAMAGMPMGAPVVGGPMPMAMNPGAMPVPQQAQQQQQPSRSVLNTYIYDYFLKVGMYDLARAMLANDQSINVLKDSPGRRNENGNGMGNGVGDDPMDTDNKDELDKRPGDLPEANVPSTSETSFLQEWFSLFWDMLNGQRQKPGGNPQVGQYIGHTQNRLKQNHQQEMLRNLRPDQMGFNPAMMRNMSNGIQMAANKNTLARTAMANNQNNPQAMAMMQQAGKQGQMQRDPSDMDGNRRPASPGSTDNAPSPSKRQRLDSNTPFNPQQGAMMPNGRPQQQGMPGQQVGNSPFNRAQAAKEMLRQAGIDPGSLTDQQFQNFQNAPPASQQKSIQTYSQTLGQQQIQQMPNKGMPTPSNPQGQGSPMMAQGPNGADLNGYYPGNELAQGAMRPGPGNGQGGGSNHALQDYQMQLMLLEQQNKKRLMMARQEQDSMGGMPRDGPGVPGGPGGPGANGQPFPDTSPQGARTGASPNPSEQMKRGTPQMNPAGIPSPLPEGAQSRGSPNPMNFMPGGNMDPNMAGAQHFFKGMNGMDPNMVNAAQMNGAMRPPSSHPNQPFNGQITPQMMAARQAQGGQGGPAMQWQGGPNGANPMVAQGPQGQGQVQGTPQQRAMLPPSAPTPTGGPANGRAQEASPATSNAAPPTPQQSNKAAPKKKENKNAKSKAAAQKKNATTGATPAAEPSQDAEPQTPATPIPATNPANFAKNGPNAGAAQPPPVANPQTSAPPAPAPVAPQAHPDPTGGFGIDNGGGMVDFGSLDFANPMASDNVLQDFDFDSFLHDNDGGDPTFDFNPNFMEGTGEITTE
ncbi:hypothetical protein BX600DRAFT_155343 [Xylariales sp. PMI_506]|nr:hypothetical protein BX600DRAFT_155343 [Xylariales sp. PMI_506]